MHVFIRRIQKMEKGIYYIYGGMFPMQLIITRSLSKKINYWLQSLRNDLRVGNEIEDLVATYEKQKKCPWREAVMEVVMRANWEKIKEEKVCVRH